MDVSPAIELRPGQPRSSRDAAFLERFNARMRLPIIVSAVLPLIIVPESNGWVGVVVGIVTWLVFLVDYVVHVRHTYRYRRTGFGRFDLFVVVATAPWFLFPGAQAGQFVVLLRLARLARLLMASRGARRLLDRLGLVVAVAVGVVVLASLVAYHAEHPVNPEFATFGDACGGASSPSPPSATGISSPRPRRDAGRGSSSWSPGSPSSGCSLVRSRASSGWMTPTTTPSRQPASRPRPRSLRTRPRLRP